MGEWRDILDFLAEAVKILGGFASFYALIKLRQIERRYLFRATVPELIESIDRTLTVLNRALDKPAEDRAELVEALSRLYVDVRNVRRKAKGDTLAACRDLLAMIETTQSGLAGMPQRLSKLVLLDIYGKGCGLLQSLEHDLKDGRWSAK